jgi:hypothetical protein
VAVDWQNVSLLGIDVGYSEKKRTTGVAIYNNGELLEPLCVGSSREARRAVIETYAPFDEIAVDGPILPLEAAGDLRRLCEYSLIGGLFAKRCKPGLSHHGEGLKLREAAARVASDEFITRKSPAAQRVFEAFPNGFLGVLIEDEVYQKKFCKIKRGKKSDVFYRYAAETGKFDTLLEILNWRDSAITEALKREAANCTRQGHERRAALICLLTAACALSGKCRVVGDEFGGTICLPPEVMWQPWAIDNLAMRLSSMRTHRHFVR